MILRAATALLLVLLPGAARAHAPFPTRGYLENGLAHTLVTLDQVVPLVALGIGIAGLGGAARSACALGFAAAALAGLHWADPFAYQAIPLLGPALLLLGGLALLAPDRAAGVTLPGLASLAGCVLGLAVYVDGPEDEGWLHFAIGALLSGGWLALMADLVWRRLPRPRLVIPQRIAGSWLVAIAILLAGAALNPRLRIDVQPGTEVLAPRPPPELDPSRQP